MSFTLFSGPVCIRTHSIVDCNVHTSILGLFVVDIPEELVAKPIKSFNIFNSFILSIFAMTFSMVVCHFAFSSRFFETISGIKMLISFQMFISRFPFSLQFVLPFPLNWRCLRSLFFFSSSNSFSSLFFYFFSLAIKLHHSVTLKQKW